MTDTTTDAPPPRSYATLPHHPAVYEAVEIVSRWDALPTCGEPYQLDPGGPTLSCGLKQPCAGRHGFWSVAPSVEACRKLLTVLDEIMHADREVRRELAYNEGFVECARLNHAKDANVVVELDASGVVQQIHIPDHEPETLTLTLAKRVARLRDERDRLRTECIDLQRRLDDIVEPG